MAHVDRHAVEERLELLRVLAQLLAVLGEARRAATLAPGAHAALHLVALVLAEIDAAQRAHELAERDEVIGLQIRGKAAGRGPRRRRNRAGRGGAGGETHAPASRAIAAGSSWSGRISSASPASATARGIP